MNHPTIILLAVLLALPAAADDPVVAPDLPVPAINTWMDWPVEPLPEPDVTNFPYGDHHRQRFDVWLADDHDGPRPVVIHWHHGGFGFGDKNMLPGAMARGFLDRGVTVISANYRFLYDSDWPAPFDDAASLVQYVRANADRFNIDPDRIGLVGSSAGGLMALWIALHDDFANPEAADPLDRVSTRVSVVAAYEAQPTVRLADYERLGGEGILGDTEVLRRYLGLPSDLAGDPDRLAALQDMYSPDSHFSPDDPPVILEYAASTTYLSRTQPLFRVLHEPALADRLIEQMRSIAHPHTVRVRGEPALASGLPPTGSTIQIVADILTSDSR